MTITKNTLEACASDCLGQNRSYFGLISTYVSFIFDFFCKIIHYFKNSKIRKCYCGDTYGIYGYLAESNCATVCAGNSFMICGGSSSNSVYKIDDCNLNESFFFNFHSNRLFHFF